MTHTGVTLIEFRNYPNGLTTPMLLQFDDQSHIFADRLPMFFEEGTRGTAKPAGKNFLNR